MTPNRIEIKQRAKECIRRASPASLLLAGVYLLLSSALPSLADLLSPDPLRLAMEHSMVGDTFSAYAALQTGSTLRLFLSLFIMLFSAVLAFGFCSLCLRLWRGEEIGFYVLLDGFSMVGRVLMLVVQIFVRLFGWAFVMTMVAAAPLGMILFSSSSDTMASVALVAASLVMNLLINVLLARYSMGVFALADDTAQPAGIAVLRGVAMTRGGVLALLKLVLSFLGWQMLVSGGTFILEVIAAALMGRFPAQITVESILLISAVPAVSWVIELLVLPLQAFVSAYMITALAGWYDTLRSASDQTKPRFYIRNNDMD